VSVSEGLITPLEVEESPAPASGTSGVGRRGTPEEQIARLAGISPEQLSRERKTDRPEESSKPQDNQAPETWFRQQ